MSQQWREYLIEHYNKEKTKNPAPGPTKMNEYLPELKKMINHKLNDENAFSILSRLLQDMGAVLAGGSVLQIIAKYEINTNTRLDLDFYCPTKNIPKFITGFVPLKMYKEHDEDNLIDNVLDNPIMTVHTSSIYSRSFLRRNGIRKIYRLSKTSNLPEAKALKKWKRDYEYAIMIDIMSVRNSRSVLDVVKNFDLSFCQVWWDGRDIFATHPKDILNKSGTLQKDYVPVFVKGNRFLKNRISKYIRRGFNISLDPTAILPTVKEVLNGNDCLVSEKTNTPDFINRLATRYIMMWLIGKRTNIGKKSIHILAEIEKKSIHNLAESGIDIDNVLIVPDSIKNFYLNRIKIHTTCFLPEQSASSVPHDIKSDKLVPDDGYDSEEYTELPKLKRLAKELVKNRPNDLVNINSINEDLIYYRETNKLLQIALYPIRGKYGIHNLGATLEILSNIPMDERKGRKYELIIRRYKTLISLKQKLEDICTRKGECYLMKTDDERVYDIHNHPLDGAISQDGLEGYLEQHIRDIDKTSVPCYYKPNPPSKQDPNPKGNCNKHISLSEVRSIVSDDFWKRYTAPTPIKTGLGESIGAWDIILTNVKSKNDNYGDIYTKTICPYCLQLQERDSGCAYMSHPNPKHLHTSEHPYCQKEFVVKEIVDKYSTAAKKITPGIPIHLEWCVECGRPSAGHEHFTTWEPLGKESPPKKPNPLNPEQMVFDYGKCAGGGRPELYARILAIREVFRNPSFKNPTEERLIAALAADNAPNDPDLMAKGREIYEKELKDRKWGNANIPENKNYNYTTNNNMENDTENDTENDMNTVGIGGERKSRSMARRSMAPKSIGSRQTRKLYKKGYKYSS